MMYDDPIPPLRYVETIPVQQNGDRYIVLRDPQGYSDSLIAVAPEAMPILAMFDGQRTLKDITVEVEQATGGHLDESQLLSMVQMLDGARLLANASFEEHRLQAEKDFRAQTLRHSSLAGGGYPENARELEAFLDQLLAAPPAEDFEPEPVQPGHPVKGILLPHIDFQRGGQTYGRAYRELIRHLPPAEEGPLLVVVIGVAHQGALSPVVATAKDFVTPLGQFPCDEKAVKLLEERLGESVFREEWVHKSEHSVELQVVWLQHLLKDRKVTFLPLLAGILDESSDGSPAGVPSIEEVVDVLRELEHVHDGPVLWLASVDFAHVGPNFGDANPVAESMVSQVERRDMEALSAVRGADAEAWWRSLSEDDNARRVCGMNATYLTLRLLEGMKTSIIDYDHAISPQNDQMVSFASALFQRP